jgi:hypothetical protein
MIVRKFGFSMRNLAIVWLPAIVLFCACAARNNLPVPSQSAKVGQVTVSFKVPVQQSSSSSTAIRPQYFSPATTTLAIALKTVNGLPANMGMQSNIFDLSKICSQSGAFFYCSTTVSVVSGDDVLGVLAYSTKPLGTLTGNIPLSFAEGEVIVGSGSSAEPAGAEDPTGRLSLVLAPVIYGGQVEQGPNASANSIPMTIAAFVDPAVHVIPADAYQNAPPFANTPHLIDSDTSGNTFLTNLNTAQNGSDITITSPTDEVVLNNRGRETAGQTVVARLSFTPRASDTDATFSIPAYFGIVGSVKEAYTIPPPGHSSDLTYSCTSAGCTQGP